MKTKELTYLANNSTLKESVTINQTATSIETLIATMLTQYILPAGIALAAGFVIYGGVLFVISSGDPEKVTKAKKTLLWALVGAFLMTFSIPIVNMVAREVGEIIIR